MVAVDEKKSADSSVSEQEKSAGSAADDAGAAGKQEETPATMETAITASTTSGAECVSSATSTAATLAVAAPAENSSGQANPESTTTAGPASVAEPAKDDASLRRRQVIIGALEYPFDLSHPAVLQVLAAAQGFTIWFQRDLNKPEVSKKGAISVQFDTEEEAKRVSEQVRPLLMRLNRSNERARKRSSLTEEASQQKKWEADDPDCFKKLYVSQLLPGTDENLIWAIFGKESLSGVEMFPDEKFKDGSRAGVLTFRSKELADQAKREFDGFSVDDGDVSRPICITYYVDRLNKLEAERLRREQQRLSGNKVQSSVKSNAVSNRRRTSSGEADSVQELRVVDSGSERQARTGSDKTANIENADSCAPSTSTSPQDAAHATKKALGRAGNLWSAQIVENRSGDVNESGAAKSGQGRKSASQPNSLPSTESSAVESTLHSPPAKHSHGSGALPVSQAPPHHQKDDSAALSVADVQRLTERIMERDRINWAELNTAHDLWMILHQAVQEAGWQPEETLKEAMMASLHFAFTRTEADWLRNHLMLLIRIWKKELENKNRSRIHKQIQLAESENTATTPGASYVPPPEDSTLLKRKKRAKRSVKELMGVGAMLATVQQDAGVADSASDERKKEDDRSRRRSRERRRRRKESASESGEASSTSSDEEVGEEEVEEDAEADRERDRQSQSSSKNSDSSDDERRRKRRKMKKRLKQAGAAPRLPFGNVSPAAMQQWIAQMMPAMIQVMPLMAQIMQMRMAAPNNMNPQQQQQMMQQLNQQMQQVNSAPPAASAAAAPSPLNQPPLHQQPMPMNWMQRMMTPNASTVPPHSGGVPYPPSNFGAPPPPQTMYSYNGAPPPSFPSPASGYSAH